MGIEQSKEVKDNDAIIVLESFDNYVKAHIARTKLENRDIPCFLTDENIITLNPFYTIAAGGIKLNVFEKDAADALKILKETDSGLDVTCIRCKSSNVKFGVTTKNPFTWLAILFSMAFMIPFSSKEKFHCNDCGLEFKDES